MDMDVLFEITAIFSFLFQATAQLTTNTTVACPNDTVIFTCSVPGNLLQWNVFPPTGAPIIDSSMFRLIVVPDLFNQTRSLGEPGYMFESSLINISGGLTATLTTVTDVLQLNGAVVQCAGVNLTISIADIPSSPMLDLTAAINDTDFSTLTLEWDPSSPPGGVSVQYILSILPPPPSGTPVIVATTTSQITISYNTPYIVNVTAENCAGRSEGLATTIEIVACPWPLTPADRVIITGPPSAPVVGSTLTFACNGQSIVSTCDSQRRWSHDPQTFNCPEPGSCSPPPSPANGSIVNNVTESSPDNTMIYYRCDNGLFPVGNQPSTCTNGMWSPNPQDQLCSTEEFTCTVPGVPSSGFLVSISNTTIVFGCNEGFYPQHNTTANCVAMDQWSSLPEENMCTAASSENIPASLSTGAAVGITLAVSAVVFTILGFLAGVAVTYLFTRKKTVYSPTEGQANVQPTVPAGPVYEDVLPAPKEEIELKTNDAYGPVRQ